MMHPHMAHQYQHMPPHMFPPHMAHPHMAHQQPPHLHHPPVNQQLPLQPPQHTQPPQKQPPQLSAPSTTSAPAPIATSTYTRPAGSGPAYHPMTLCVTGVPSYMTDDDCRQLLQCCGAVQRWVRPVDPLTEEVKSFGLCTFREGQAALRCKNVLHGWELPAPSSSSSSSPSSLRHSHKLVVRGGSKEEALLVTIAEKERAVHSTPAVSTTVTAEDGTTSTTSTPGKDADTKQLLDDPVREEVRAVLLRLQEEGMGDERRRKEAEAPAPDPPPVEPYTLQEGDEGYDREKAVQTEIDHFRREQAVRNREEVTRRQERLKRQLQRLQADWQRNQARDKERQAREEQESHEAAKRSRGETAQPGEGDSAKRQRVQQVMEMVQQEAPADQYQLPLGDLPAPKLVMKAAASLKPKVSKAVVRGGGFSTAEDDEQDTKQMRTLVPLDYTAEEEAQGQMAMMQQQMSRPPSSAHTAAHSSKPASGPSSDEGMTAQQRLKALADAIPTGKDALFAYAVDWEACDRHGVVDATIKAWVVKKFVEYLGQEEESITSFIVTKLKQHCRPQELLDELFPVLDSDAEPFVLKLWRLLAFSAVKAGLQ